MANTKVICDREDIVAIADAVRNKTGVINEMTLGDITTNINKITTSGGVVLPTLTNEGSASDLLSGKQLIDSDGNIVEGAMPSTTQVTPSITVDANGLITSSVSQTEGYVVEGTKSATKQLATQVATLITPSAAFQTAIPSGIYTTGAVTVAPIPAEYIVPQGELEVAQNGTYDVTEKTSVVVAIPERQIVLQNLEITENGTYTADANYDGIGQVTVSVLGGNEATDDRDQYQRVEYITSAEDETYPYIITDFIADNSCGLEVVASFPKLQDRIPMGSRLDANATRFYCVYPMSASSVYYGFNTGASISCALSVNTIYRLQTNFLNSRLVNVYTEDGTRKANASLNATLTQQSVPVSIFGYNSGSSGVVSSKREFKLYSARCSRNHEVVRDYAPCYRKSDGEIGLYEKVTGQFLTNIGGGAFTKGADIDW